MDFPSDVRKPVPFYVQVPELDTHLLEGVEPEMDPSIVVYAEEVELALDRDLDLHRPEKGNLTTNIPVWNALMIEWL